MGKRRRNRNRAKILSTKQSKKSNGHTLSVCMITKNEAERIERAIRSVLAFADEVVVVDTGSTDQTVEIAAKLGAKIGYFEWCDDFAAARNASIDLATGDWIMWLDADDYIPSTEWRKLQKLKKMEPTNAFMFLLKNEGVGRETLWQLRMFPNLPSIRFIYPVHEQVAPSLKKAGFPFIKAEVTVVHTGYDSKEKILAKKNKYLKLLLKRIENKPDDYLSRLHIGIIYYSIDKNEEAIEYLKALVGENRFYLQHKEPYAIAAIFLSRTYIKCGKYKEAKQLLEKTLASGHKSGLLFVSLSECYNHLGSPRDALALLKKYSSYISAPTLIPTDLEALEVGALLQQAIAYRKLGQLKEALLFCRKHIEANSRFDDLRLLAEEILKDIENSPNAISILKEITSSPFASPDDLFTYATVLVRKGELANAENVYKDVLRRDPGHARARRVLATLLRHRGQPKEASLLLQEGLMVSNQDTDLLWDLVDLYFDQGQWNKILDLQATKDLWVLNFAAYVHTGIIAEASDEELYDLLKPIISTLSPLEELTVEKIWSENRRLNPREKFYLATACAKLDPSLKDAVSVAVKGYLNRGKIDDALSLAESLLQYQPADSDVFEWMARCYQMKGLEKASALCSSQAAKLASSPLTGDF